MNEDLRELIGTRMQDKVTGFAGEVTAVIYYAHDTPQLKLEKMTQEGKVLGEWFVRAD